MANNLEGLLEKAKAGTLYSNDIIRGFELISRGDNLQLRDPTGPIKLVAGAVAWPFKKALFKGDRTYDTADNLLEAVGAETVEGGGRTHAAVVASLYDNFITYDRNMKLGDVNAGSGKRGAARANFEAAITAAGEMTNLVDTHMVANLGLKGYIAARKADAQAKIGEFQGAYDTLATDELADNEEAQYKSGEIKFEQGNYRVAESHLRKVYDRNPKREGLVKKLTDVYGGLAGMGNIATTDPTGDDTIDNNWQQALQLLATDGTREQKAKIQEVINGIGVPAAGEDNKVSLLARAYHAMAKVNVRERNYTSAIDKLRMSIDMLTTPDTLGTPEAYRDLAKVHTMAAR